jgi:hypothetical protein
VGTKLPRHRAGPNFLGASGTPFRGQGKDSHIAVVAGETSAGMTGAAGGARKAEKEWGPPAVEVGACSPLVASAASRCDKSPCDSDISHERVHGPFDRQASPHWAPPQSGAPNRPEDRGDRKRKAEEARGWRTHGDASGRHDRQRAPRLPWVGSVDRHRDPGSGNRGAKPSVRRILRAA